MSPTPQRPACPAPQCDAPVPNGLPVCDPHFDLVEDIMRRDYHRAFAARRHRADPASVAALVAARHRIVTRIHAVLADSPGTGHQRPRVAAHHQEIR